MTNEHVVILCGAILMIGFLYSSVGHAGASGYIAVMSLMGLDPSFIKPTALLLNVLVATITAWQFFRAGHFSWRLFWPFAVLAVPLAFVGGYIDLPTRYFKILVGIVLLYSAYRFMIRPSPDTVTSTPKVSVAVTAGGCLGFLAGLTGTGGGIFLTPLLLFNHWARVKQAAAVSALFILLNSASGLWGHWSSTRQIPPVGWVLALSAVMGGSLGSYYGSRRFDPVVIKRMLAVVLLIAGAKLILTR